MQGKKTHEQFERTLERKPDLPKPHSPEKRPERTHSRAPRNPAARQSEMAVSRHGTNQEDRQQNSDHQDNQD